MKILTKMATLICLLIFFPIISEAQVCKTASILATTPSNELIDNGDGTVTDMGTGLMWKQCAEGLSGLACEIGTVAQHYAWQDAFTQVQIVNGVGFASYKDWRLPNIKELRSIVERQCYEPAINLVRFPNTVNDAFWSASPYSGNIYRDGDNNVWFVDFSYGYDRWEPKNSPLLEVRLVRNAP